jgi:hypothetical protein
MIGDFVFFLQDYRAILSLGWTRSLESNNVTRVDQAGREID